MRREILAALVAGGLAGLGSQPAQALGPAGVDPIAASGLVHPAMSAAKERRLYMMRSIQRQQAYGRGHRFGPPPGYGGYGPRPRPPGYYGAPPRGYYGPPRGGYYGY